MVLHALIGGFSDQLIAVIALFATANTVLVMLIVGARMIYGMAKEKTLPFVLAKVHKIRRTPWTAIAVFGVLCALFVFIESIEVVAALTDIGLFVLFFFVNISAIILRFKEPDLERPWKMPFNLGKLPLISVLGALTCLVMIFSLNHPVTILGFELSSLLFSLIVFGSSVPLYFLFGRKN
jgi:APA family basic amino acid/polyamine antiporter